MAAGLTLREDSYQTFVDGLDAAVREFSGKATFDPVIETDGSLESGYANADVAGLLQRQVWGAGFPPPVFRDTFLVCQQRLLKDKHPKPLLQRHRQPFDDICFNHPGLLSEFGVCPYRPAFIPSICTTQHQLTNHIAATPQTT